MRVFTLKEWQLMYENCPIHTEYKIGTGDFLCTRIENTQFEYARKFGTISYFGHKFSYVVAKAGGGMDGGELIVRDDFLRWVENKGRALVIAKRRENAPIQDDLFANN